MLKHIFIFLFSLGYFNVNAAFSFKETSAIVRLGPRHMGTDRLVNGRHVVYPVLENSLGANYYTYGIHLLKFFDSIVTLVLTSSRSIFKHFFVCDFNALQNPGNSTHVYI
jgi:hypothetical protein